VHELANRWGTLRLSVNVKAVWAELLLPARKLLVVIGDLFVELMPVEVYDAIADDLSRATLMRLALAEVTEGALLRK
jgi:hypothetical protein